MFRSSDKYEKLATLPLESTSQAPLSRSWNLTATHYYSITSANLCLMPEFAARLDNLTNVIDRSKKMAQYFGAECNIFVEQHTNSQVSEKDVGFKAVDGAQFVAMSNSPSLHTIDTDSSHNYSKFFFSSSL